jgi:hypothetical protein
MSFVPAFQSFFFDPRRKTSGVNFVCSLRYTTKHLSDKFSISIDGSSDKDIKIEGLRSESHIYRSS